MKSFQIDSPKLNTHKDFIFSEDFQDVYHSKQGALDQALSVFIEGNSLNSRWKDRKSNFSICELGFGFGISFSETAKEWKKINQEQILHYTSIEKTPVSKAQLVESHNHIFKTLTINSDYNQITNSLLNQYPKNIRGFHRIFFQEFRILLTLIFEDVEVALSQIYAEQDAWFLDGFSPQKNPKMWDENIFKQIYELTTPQGTFATYSVSRIVKDNATKAGFTIKVQEGFGAKKHKLCGIKNIDKASHTKKGKNIAIIGGGISGFSIALALSKRNIKCTVFEKENSHSLGASSNQSAVIMPQLSSKIDDLSEFYLHGYLHTISELRKIHDTYPLASLDLNGALRIASAKKWTTVRERFIDLGLNEIGKTLTSSEINSLCNIRQNKDGILFFEAGSVKPKDVIESIIKTYNTKIKIKYDSEIKDLNDLSNSGFSDIIFANAYHAAYMSETSWLPVEKIKGQLFSASIKNSEDNQKPKIPICYDGYITPIANSPCHIIGASYEHNKHETEFDLQTANDLSQRLTKNTGLCIDQIIEGKVCFRTTSPDRLPMIGKHCNKSGEFYDNLYISLGHGSRGMVSCFIAGEIIADEILEQQPPIPLHIKNALSPMRYILRERKREVSTEDSYPASYVWR